MPNKLWYQTLPRATYSSRKKASRNNQPKNWFCVKYSKIWEIPISARIHAISKKFNMTWLRVSMSYSCFPNLGEMLNGDLGNKIMKDVDAFGFQDKPCNCTVTTLKKDGTCRYEKLCQRATIIYNQHCLITGKYYYGKTQKYLKVRMLQHFQDVWCLLNRDWK